MKITLFDALVQRQMSIQYLSEQTGIRRSTISNHLKGKHLEYTDRVREAFEKAIGLPPGSLVVDQSGKTDFPRFRRTFPELNRNVKNVKRTEKILKRKPYYPQKKSEA